MGVALRRVRTSGLLRDMAMKSEEEISFRDSYVCPIRGKCPSIQLKLKCALKQRQRSFYNDLKIDMASSGWNQGKIPPKPFNHQSPKTMDAKVETYFSLLTYIATKSNIAKIRIGFSFKNGPYPVAIFKSLLSNSISFSQFQYNIPNGYEEECWGHYLKD